MKSSVLQRQLYRKRNMSKMQGIMPDEVSINRNVDLLDQSNPAEEAMAEQLKLQNTK